MDRESVTKIVESIIILAAAFAVFFGLKRAFRILAERANLPTLAFRPFRLTIRYAVLAVAICLILARFGFDVSAIVAVLGTILGLVAIGFVAVWSILSNVLCTFVLILFQPFAVGDELDFPAEAVSGKVVDLTLIFTTLRTASGEYIQVPNNMFFQKIFKRKMGAKSIRLEDQLRQQNPTT